MKPRSSRFALLGLLALRPMSGYEIRKTIERSISNFWNESFGQIYPTLADLVAEGLVREVPSKSRSRLFEPTEKGKKELERWLAEPIELSVSRNVFLLKLFLARFAGPEATRRHFDEFRAGHRERLREYAATRVWLKSALRSSAHLAYWLAALDYGVAESKALLEWAGTAERDLALTSTKNEGARRK